jgi:hypothetical protein
MKVFCSNCEHFRLWSVCINKELLKKLPAEDFHAYASLEIECKYKGIACIEDIHKEFNKNNDCKYYEARK